MMSVGAMRVAGPVVALVALLLSSSAPGPSVQADRPISALSRLMMAEAMRHSADGELDRAIDFFEAALVADPRNADAYIGLAQVARRQQLPGKAIGHLRVALALRPNDRLALAEQGSALAARGATSRAQANLALLNRLCADDPCAERDMLARALGQQAAPTPVVRRDDILPEPAIAPLDRRADSAR